MAEELISLANLISGQVRSIDSLCSSKNTNLPSINEAEPDLAIMNDPEFMKAADIIVAAARRLIASVRNPSMAMVATAAEMYASASLQVAVEANVTEALREAGPQGLHVRDLASKVGVNPGKLGRLLRYLCTVHQVYREVSPNVFTNNRLSGAMDTGKPFDEVSDRGPLRYDGAKGCASIVGHTTDEIFKGAQCLPKLLLDPETTNEDDPKNTAVMKAYNFKGSYMDFIEQPEQEKIYHRVHNAMRNTDSMYPKEMIVNHFDWGTLPKGSLVVDVGGGMGGSTLPLAKAFTDLRFVVQDLPSTIPKAEKFWKDTYPEAIGTGLVQLQAHDFFKPQPIQDAAVFFLRFVIHDWADSYAKPILRNLRDVAKPNTRLILFEQIVPYACPVQDDPREIPDVLQGNMPPAGGMLYMVDMQMMCVANALERTAGDWIELTKASGWEVEEIRPGPLCSIKCKPI